MRTIDVVLTLATTYMRRRVVSVAAEKAALPPGTRVRVRLRRPVEVAGGRGVAFVPYFAETVYT